MSRPPPAPLVLVVDDDQATRWLAREVLEVAGFVVLEASDGDEALHLQAMHRPEALLLDLCMPRLDGYEVIRRVRQRTVGAVTPIMVMTTKGDVDAIERAFELGASDFLLKPLTLPLLGHRIRYMLRAAAAFQDAQESARRLARAQRLARVVHWRMRDGRFAWASDPLVVFGVMTSGRGAGSRPQTMDLLSMVHPDDLARVAEAMQRPQAHQLDYRVILPDGSLRQVHQDAEPDPAGPAGSLFGATQDVTAMRVAEQEIIRLAFYDEATGLPNREFLRRYLARAAAEHGPWVSVVSIDLGIARIKDSLGAADDAVLLAAIARVIEQVALGAGCPRCLRADRRGCAGVEPEHWEGELVVARVADDELAVALRGRPHLDVLALVEQLAQALARSFRVEDSEVVIAASVGVASSPGHVEDPRLVAHCAHVAMASSRELGRSAAMVFDAELDARGQRKMEVSRLLHRAVARLRQPAEASEFVLHYQPKIDLATGLLTGVEALLRWRPPEHDEVFPDQFIPIAEATGVIVPLGEWVLREACQQGARWVSGGVPMRVAVNISARQLRDPGFVAQVVRAANQRGFSPALLELEITEHVTMHDLEHAVRVLRELKSLGVQIALDDFGMGYSSLSYLSQLPIDVLKIDRSFILPVGKVASAEAIPSAIIAMARSLGLRVVAEGVETIAQAEFLDRQGASELQGYLFARPMPAAELDLLLATGGRRFASAGTQRRASSSSLPAPGATAAAE